MAAHSDDTLSRREFNKKAAAAGVSLALPASGVFAAGSDTVRVAMVGCGDRGTVDAVYCLKSAPGVELVAMADLFEDKVEASLAKLRQEVPDQVKVPAERIFLGFDAYEQVLALDDVNLVMLLTPPGFRPQMVAAGVEAGKHMFVEKPGAVDPVGIRTLIEASARADREGRVSRRGHPAAVRAPVPRARSSGSGTARSESSRTSRRSGSATWSSGTTTTASRRGATWSGRCAAGHCSPGCPATTTSSSWCTTSTW